MNMYTLIKKSTLKIDGTIISSIGIFLYISNKYISNISNLYNPNETFLVSISNKMWQHVFRSRRKIIYFHLFFQLRTWFVFYFFSYVVIIYLLWRWEGVGSYFKMLSSLIESTQAKLSQINASMNIFPTRCRAE